MKKIVFFSIAFLFLITSCSNYCPEEEAVASIAKMEDLEEEFDDTMVMFTGRTGTTSSGRNPIEIQEEVEDLEVPECLDWAHSKLLDMMEHGVNSYLAAIEGESLGIVNVHVDRYEIERDNFLDALDEVSGCLPNCKKP